MAESSVNNQTINLKDWMLKSVGGRRRFHSLVAVLRGIESPRFSHVPPLNLLSLARLSISTEFQSSSHHIQLVPPCFVIVFFCCWAISLWFLLQSCTENMIWTKMRNKALSDHRAPHGQPVPCRIQPSFGAPY
jgi:hypothetical protein